MRQSEAIKIPNQDEEFTQLGEAMFAKRIDRWHKKIVEEFDDRPDIYDFVDLYQKDEIKADEKTVTNLEKKWDEELAEKRNENPKGAEISETNKKLSEAMEILIGHYSETNAWFGDEAMVARTTKYDDYVNGTDLIVYFGSEEEPVALSIDVTSASNLSVIDKKVSRCCEKSSHRSKEKTAIKYVESPYDGSHISLDYTIPLTIGFENKTAAILMANVAELQELLYKKGKNDLDKKKISVLKKIIAESPVQMVMLKEIYLQLELIIKKLELQTNSRPGYLEQLKNIATKIDSAFFKKNGQKIKIADEDKVFKQIKSTIEKLNAQLQ